MKRITTTTIMVALLVILSGCSFTQKLSRQTLKVRSSDINVRSAIRGPVSLIMRSDVTPVYTTYFNIQGDSALWIDPVSGDPRGANLSSISSITVRDRTDGMLKGSAAGTALGLAIGYATASSEPNPSGKIGITTLVGYLVGGVIGFAVGDRTTYEIDNAPPR